MVADWRFKSLKLGTGTRVTSFSTTATLGTSDAAVPTQKAVKTYVDTGVKVAKIALTPGNANAFAVAWQNPESVAIFALRPMIDITTPGGTATSVLDMGIVANATSTASDLLNDVDANAAGLSTSTAILKVDANGGTNDWITVKILTANAAALAGFAYIPYFKAGA